MIGRKAGRSKADREMLKGVKDAFKREMDDDLNVGKAFDRLYEFVDGIKIETLEPDTASGLVIGLKQVDEVLRVLF